MMDHSRPSGIIPWEILHLCENKAGAPNRSLPASGNEIGSDLRRHPAERPQFLRAALLMALLVLVVMGLDSIAGAASDALPF